MMQSRRAFGPRLSEGLTVREQFWRASVMIGTRGPSSRFFGSGFFAADVDWSRPFVDDERATMFMVTAAHNVREGFHHFPDGLCARLQTYMGHDVDVPLPPLNAWTFAPDTTVVAEEDEHPEGSADIAIVPLPELRHSRHVGGISAAAVSGSQLYVAEGGWVDDFRLGDRSHFIGLWTGATVHPQLIMRTGFIATATADPVRTPVGPARVYLFDAMVTPGMSGGLVYASHGGGGAENAVMGVIQGLWPVTVEAFEQQFTFGPETDEQRWRRSLDARLTQINSGLALVTPIHHVARLLHANPLWGRRMELT